MNLADKIINTPSPQKAEESRIPQEPPPRQREGFSADEFSDDDLSYDLPCTD